MGLWEKIFLWRRRDRTQDPKMMEYSRLLYLRNLIDRFSGIDHYVARSEYEEELEEFGEDINFFEGIIAENLLDEFCKKNAASSQTILETIADYKDIAQKIEMHNEDYISQKLNDEKEYLDSILYPVDPHILLDEDQRRVVLSDEDYMLVIAGAGAGKSTTVAAKVRYLVERKQVEPSEILVISFTNKAVNELKEKINRDLKIPCPIATFHSTGNAVLHKKSPENLNIADGSKLYWCIMDYLKNNVLQNASMVDNLILFFASYFEAPFTGKEINEFFYKISKTGYATLKSDLDEVKEEIIDSRSKKCVTIQNELLRSVQEVEIANYLYLNNIEYQYEVVYPYNLKGSLKPYTPDFLLKQGDLEVYLEHFGITESGENFLYSKEQVEYYKRAVNQKILHHREHGTKLIYTFSAYNDNRPLLNHLKEELIKCGFELCPKNNEEVLKKIIATEENKYIRKLADLVCRFINNFKTNGYAAEKFDQMWNATENVRNRLFLSICKECFFQYERWLEEKNAIDFQDMINQSARILQEAKDNQIDLGFRYIIVDEYQDISRQRFDLTKALSEATKAKIIAVGDDWQSIYAFSGSDITLFTKFAEQVGYAKQLKIVKTYRNSQEVIDIAGSFVQKNSSQIKKQLISPKNTKDPVIIYTYDPTLKKAGENNRTGANYAAAHAVEIALEQIMEFNRKEREGRNGTILLLGRFGFDGERLERSGLFEFINRGGKIKSVKYPQLNITFMTAHSSKGLGYDNVIIINGKNESYGFPSKIEDDPVLSFVVREDRSIEYAEERRLFYVAMTRTKNRVFFIAPEKNPSEFLLELKHDYKNVVLQGKWNEEEPTPIGKKSCPICGFPLQLRYKKAYGLKLYLCTNEPEMCSFMTNDLAGGKMSIMKCDECRTGYLVVKKSGTENRFLGCTNYNKKGTGCKKTISQIQYYKMMHYQWGRQDQTHEKEKELPVVKAKAQKSQRQTKETCGQVYKHYPEIKKKEITSKSKYGIEKMNDYLYTILMCLNHLSEDHYYGVETLLDTLQGAQTPRIIKDNLQDIPEYGELSAVLREHLNFMVEWMIEKSIFCKQEEHIRSCTQRIMAYIIQM